MSNEMLYWRNLKYLVGYLLCVIKSHPNPYKDYGYRCSRCHHYIYADVDRGFML